MTVRSRWAAIRRAVPILLAAALVPAACGSPASPRPTDARGILAAAIAASAAVPTVRIHVEIVAPIEGAADNTGAVPTFQLAVDADVDVATRQLTGRVTARLPQRAGGVGNGLQTADVIIAQGATFSRQGGSPRWMKGPQRGPDGGPTNDETAAILLALLSKPTTRLELGTAAPCTLGTCDHVTAQVVGESLWALLAPILGMGDRVPVDPGARIDLDILVDQATSVVSEVRAETATAAVTTTFLITISAPGEPILIGPPPAVLVDDFGDNSGGGGEPVPVETLPPVVESPPAP